MSSRTFAAALCALVAAGVLCAQEKPVSKEEKEQAELLRLQKLVSDVQVDVSKLDREMPLSKFLAAVEELMPKDKKTSFRLDKTGLGKDYAKVADAPVRVSLAKVSLPRLLSKALSQSPVEVAYAIRPSGVVVTRPRLAVYTLAYRIDDLLGRLPALAPDLERWRGYLGQKDRIREADGEAILSRMLSEIVELKPFESLEIVNGTKLVAIASPGHHEEIGSLIEALRRLGDEAVVMNARLYEIDLTAYGKHVAGLLKKDDEGNRPAVVEVGQKALKAVLEGKLVAQSDFVKLRRNESAAFLSKQAIYRYVASRQDDREQVRTGRSGVSFRVRPLVSPDRRFLRLEITQEVNQLVKIDKVRKPDLGSGKPVEVESPNVRRATRTGTVTLPDGGALLMPVDYLPATKGRAWVLVARPMIWIEEEQKELRKNGHEFSPEGVWKEEVSQDGPAASIPERRLASDDRTTQILQAVLEHVLTSRTLKDEREARGTAKRKAFALVDGDKVGWPAKFVPQTHGHDWVKMKFDPFATRRPLLGVRLDQFDLDRKTKGKDAPIVVTLYDHGELGILDDCRVSYVPRRAGKRWTVECVDVSGR